MEFPHTLVTKQEIRDKLELMLASNEIREMLQLCYHAYYEKIVFSGDTQWPNSLANRFKELQGGSLA